LVSEGRTGVDEARTRVNPGVWADNDIHRLVRVTAYHVLVYEDLAIDGSPNNPRFITAVMDLGI
jgi:hypothetical protein